MLFNSWIFLVFFAVVSSLYRGLNLRGQNRLLLVASYVFYGCWDWRFLSLLALSTAVDFYCGRKIEDTQDAGWRKFYLGCSLFTNLGLLGFFKYFNFFITSFERMLASFGLESHAPTLSIILPVGISFYTFQTLSYSIDIYRGQLKPVRNLVDFALFVSFFPQLVAGPIERAKQLLPQIQSERRWNTRLFLDGVWLVLLGLMKKVIIADQLAGYVNVAFAGTAPPYPGIQNWMVLYAFAFQIYGDFSGYSDIARGISKMMGFELMINFRSPYLVRNVAEFWRHWHISLSTWLRDYLFIPLGGSRGSAGSTMRNLMTTMVLGGLWHGAGWAFVLWGFYQGVILVLHRVYASRRMKHQSCPTPSWRTALAMLGTFHVVCIGWLLFRAGSVPEGSQITVIQAFLATLFKPVLIPEAWAFVRPVGLLCALGLFFQARTDRMENFSSWHPTLQVLAPVSALILITLLGVADGTAFIYFQF